MRACRPSAAMASSALTQSKCGTATPAPSRCLRASPAFDRTENVMVDFSLTDADRRLVALAREEAAIGLTYSRYYDKHEDEIEPKVFPDVAGRPTTGVDRTPPGGRIAMYSAAKAAVLRYSQSLAVELG